ncbi:calcium-channel protein CCH1 [Blumeria hordei DH14]|uniref:Calcium-channel protein CCH1 n=1 Tax=Blumeria graminis f. sp. hordei (strain DH14) TaxID=546991 RepID=N1JB26_BLUG1|nr:calcium-channel protein CCH1 [Blumeria hordei DH14]
MTTPQSIPLKNLSRSPCPGETGTPKKRCYQATNSVIDLKPIYTEIEDSCQDIKASLHRAKLTTDASKPHKGISTENTKYFDRNPETTETQSPPGFAGLLVPNINITRVSQNDGNRYSTEYSGPLSPYGDVKEDSTLLNSAQESDRVLLIDQSSIQPISGAEMHSNKQEKDNKLRLSFQDGNPEVLGAHCKSKNTGNELRDTEAGLRPNLPARSTSSRIYGIRSRSPTNGTGALSRAGSIVRAMSQRVVNISGEVEVIEATARREASKEENEGAILSTETRTNRCGDAESQFPNCVQEDNLVISSNIATRSSIVATEKTTSHCDVSRPENDQNQIESCPNPLRGKSLGIFSPDSLIRNKLCDLLVYPLTEPVILILIIVQTVLLTFESSQDVYKHPRQKDHGISHLVDYALTALFTVFTFELAARILVSGFIVNSPEHSTRIHHKSVKQEMLHRYRRVFKPHRSVSVRKNIPKLGGQTVLNSFTYIQGGSVRTVEQAQRQQLARRAFLRHSFNRLDFVAVCSFWISMVLNISGVEDEFHLYIFRMLSCLRILRLLALTNGTAIILRSLKKAAPLLVSVSFLIGFFWLLFAIIGVQSFKSSLDRQCVWVDQADPTNSTGSAYINKFQFCGGQLNINTGAREPWMVGTLENLSSASESSKGYLCPRGSYCLELPPEKLPYNGTVSFDNIFQSLELVFVIMTANTFTDIMYYTMDSDYMAAALFFAGGIVIMMLWLLNLLIAVITSSFQVIREEGKSSAFATHARHLPASPKNTTLPINSSTLKDWYEKSHWLWIAIIAYGILCQTFRSSSMSNSRAKFIDMSELTVTLLLILEIIVRFSVDWRGFLLKRRNWADLSLAIITAVILIPPIRNSGRPFAWLTAFQIIRIYRVIIAVPLTRSLIILVLGHSSGIGNLILFVFLITYLMSILAVQLFRGELPSEDAAGEVIQVTFSTIWNAFLGMYQVLSSENWTAPLYDLTSSGAAHKMSWIPGVFLIGWYILGNFILVNMFIAVIQESFDVSEDEKRMHQVKAFLNRKELGSSCSNLSLSAILRLGRSRYRKDPLDHGPATMEMLLKDAVVRDFLDGEINENRPPATPSRPCTETIAKHTKARISIWQRLKTQLQNREPNPFYSNIQISTGADEFIDARTMAKEAVSATSQRKKAQREYLARHPNYNTALFIFKPDSIVRRLCQRIVGPGRGSERFDGVEPNRVLWYSFSALIYAAIVAMVLLACVITPLYQREYFSTHEFRVPNWFIWSDMAFAVLFTIEALIKVIADGFFWTPNAYFRSSWGLIDAFVLITFWINVITLFYNDGAVSRAVGAFKALRALRLLNVSDSARDTFHSLIIIGGWKILSAAFVSLSLLLPFAIYGLNLFNGQMLSCNDSDPTSIHYLTDCFGEYNSTPFSSEWPILAPRVVSNPFFDFDNFGSSLFILFQIVSQEGWVDVMWAAQSIVGRGLQPQPFSSQGNAIFFVVFNLLATVFVLTLFISVFMRNYTEQTGIAFLTADQRSWMELRKLLKQVAPSKRPSINRSNSLKAWCNKVAIEKHGKWQRFITIILVLHLLLLLAEYYPQSSWWEHIRNYMFFIFMLIFMTNTMIRIIGLSWTQYRRSSWDMFSLFAVLGSFASTILLLFHLQVRAVVLLHKLFLVMMVLLLIPRNDALDQLFKTAAASVVNIGNLLATWFVLFLVYAIAMTQSFGLTRFGPNEDNNQNFRTVPKALILLFRMSCGEGWNVVMEDYATILPPLCVSDSSFFNSDCGSSQWSRALFISWNILSMYIFTSLFVSLIYESFSYVYQNSGGLNKLNREELRHFKKAWATLDPSGSGFITKDQFPRLLKELSGILTMKIYPPEHSVRQILEDIKGTSGKSIEIPASSRLNTDFNINNLNLRLAEIDVVTIRQARHQYKLFYEEVMISADIDKGISFTSVLMILAHYNVICDNKNLRLEEFLRRRARLQRVEEEVRRRTVLGFFDTMYWSRRFRQHMEKKRSLITVGIPKLGPGVSVDEGTTRIRPVSRTVSPIPSSLSSSQKMADINTKFSEEHEELSKNQQGSTSPSGVSAASSPGPSPQLCPSRALSIALALDGGDQRRSGNSSRRGSSVSVENVLEVLDDSAWGESIRRSCTMRRPSNGGGS